MPNTKRLAVTGANGFLGRHVIQRAVAEGWSVVGVVRRAEASATVEAAGAKAFVSPRLEATGLRPAFEGCSAVVHLAGIARATGAQSFEEVNVGGVRAVIDAASAAGISRLVTPSGLGVHLVGKADWANNDYFRSKLKVEEVVSKGAVPGVLFRPSYILGPGDEMIPSLVRSLRTGLVRIPGDGKTPMQPIFVEDAARAFLAAADGRGPAPATYDLVGPEVADVLDLVELAAAVMREAKLPIPPTRLEHIPWDRAAAELGLSTEEIDVMRCDYIGDASAGPKALGYTLSSLSKAVRAAVAPEIQ